MASSSSGYKTATSKEIKTQLKQARELINKKDHIEALKLCEVIISCLYYVYVYFNDDRELLQKIKHAIWVGL